MPELIIVNYLQLQDKDLTNAEMSNPPEIGLDNAKVSKANATRNFTEISNLTEIALDNATGLEVNTSRGFTVFDRLVASTEVTYMMKDLLHFAAYNIEIQACTEPGPDEKKDHCSTKSMRTFRTLPSINADDIPSENFTVTKTVSNYTLTLVKLQWLEPPDPNGLIITYEIEYKRVDIQNVSSLLHSQEKDSRTLKTVAANKLFQIKPTRVCITRYEFFNASRSYILKDLPSGNYSVRVRAESLAGKGEYTLVKYFYIKEYNSHAGIWGYLLTITAMAILGILLIYLVYKHKYKRSVPNMRLIATVNPEYVSTIYIPDEWEVPRKKVQVLRELGNGSFGMVYEGIAKNIVKGKAEVRCAVKTVNEQATDRERIEFLNEASVMK